MSPRWALRRSLGADTPAIRIGLWASEPAVLNATVVGRPSWHRWSWWVNFDGGTLREGKATTLKAACRAAEAVAAEIPAEVVARLRFLANLPSADLDAACAGRASTLEPGA